MPDLLTERLQLHAVDVPEAQRIVAQTPDADEHWADDFPFDGDLLAVNGFLRASAAHGEQRPFGYYRISRLTDGHAVGGVGFKGGPRDGVVEVGYGLAPSARGNGYAAEALIAVLEIAAEQGVGLVKADTALDNVASQRTLIHAGFRLVSSDPELNYYELQLGGLSR